MMRATAGQRLIKHWDILLLWFEKRSDFNGDWRKLEVDFRHDGEFSSLFHLVINVCSCGLELCVVKLLECC
jgi:hypothetical protein